MAAKRGYSKRLTEQETLKLIDSRTLLQYEFSGKMFNRKEAWKCVAEDSGIDIGEDQLAKKWSNLLLTYKKLINPPTGTGTDANELTPENWPYFEKMHAYCSDKHNIYPPKLISSEEIESSPQDVSRSSLHQNNSDSRDISEVEYFEPTELDFSEELRTSTRMSSTTEASTSSGPRPKKSKIDETIAAMEKSRRKMASRINKVLHGITAISSSSDSDE